jgi:hypothetical protein
MPPPELDPQVRRGLDRLAEGDEVRQRRAVEVPGDARPCSLGPGASGDGVGRDLAAEERELREIGRSSGASGVGRNGRRRRLRLGNRSVRRVGESRLRRARGRRSLDDGARDGILPGNEDLHGERAGAGRDTCRGTSRRGRGAGAGDDREQGEPAYEASWHEAPHYGDGGRGRALSDAPRRSRAAA